MSYTTLIQHPTAVVVLGMVAGAGSSQAFVPSDLSGLVNWYKILAENVTIDTGIGVVTDLSGGGRHLVQATAARQPAFNATGTPNGRPCATHDGTDDRLRVTYAEAQPEDVYCYARISRSAAANKDLYDGATGNTRRLFSAGTGFGGQIGIHAGATLAPTGNALDAWHFMRAEYADDDGAFTVDGVRTAGDVGGAASGGLIVGSFGDQSSNHMDGDWAEIIIYNHILPADEAALVHGYLLGEYS